MFLRTYMLLSIIWRHLGTDWTIRLTLKTDVQDHSNSPVCHDSDKNVKPTSREALSKVLRHSFHHGTSDTKKQFYDPPKSVLINTNHKDPP